MAECGLQPKAGSQASACTPKFRGLPPAPQGSNAESAKPTSQEGTGTPQKGRERLCTICKTVQYFWSHCHCQLCHNLYQRVNHWKTGLDIASIKVWDKIDKGRKADFIRSAKSLTGQHLKAQMKQFISEDQKSMLRLVNKQCMEPYGL